MPKSQDKTGSRKRKKKSTESSANAESDASEPKALPKKKKTQRKRNTLDGIDMCKQLATQFHLKNTTRKCSSSKKNNEPRLCGNGKPMPSLAELEAMYEDSDDDDDSAPPKNTHPPKNERCETPVQLPLVPDGLNLDSPETLKKLTSKVIDILSKTINLDDDDVSPPPPVIPQKRPKRNGDPYIVGCKQRKQVPWAPKSKFGVDTEEYGVDPNQPEDEVCDNEKRKKRGQKVNLSKSIFNAKTDEIAERLKELETTEPSRSDSPDSNKTLDYDFPSNSSPTIPRAFSPLPSTSRDRDTILKNDELFNESLKMGSLTKPSDAQQNSPIAQNSPNEVEVVEVPCETVVIDDLPDTNIPSKKRGSFNYDDDCCVIVEPESKRRRVSVSPVKANSPPKDEIYGSIDLTQTFDDEVMVINDDDFDSLVAENKALLEKEQKKIDTVTIVDPNIITIESETVSQDSQHPVNSSHNQPSPSNTGHSFGTAVKNAVEIVDIRNEENNYVTLTSETAAQGSTSTQIAEVVNNFFAQPPDNMSARRTPNESRSTSTIDLTSSQETMMSRISSWIHSIESFLGGRQSTRTNIPSEVQSVDNYVPPVPNSGATYTELGQIRHNRDSNSVSHQQQRLNESIGVSIPQPPNQAISPSSTSTQVAQPPTTASSQPSPPRRGLDCPICMDSLTNTSVASTMCGHIFCMACIKAAIRANGKKCPTCRKALKGAGYHQLFL